MTCRKNNFSFLILTLSLLILSSACGKQGLSPRSCSGDFLCLRGIKIAWKEGSTIEFKLSSTVPVVHRQPIADAATEYNTDILTTETIVIDPTLTDAPPYSSDHKKLNKDGVNAVYNISGAWPYASSHPGSKAITLTRYSGIHIVEADIYFKGGQFLTTASADQWMDTLMLHELGHALGRVHSKEAASIMFPTLNTSHTTNGFSPSDIFSFSLAY